ncbi:MAG: hypothetical protein A2X04_07515 [Bacteroidetes bacterium GWF2_41_9]|nr:MAG: hypothetical protein A2X03_06390 [Bacteroidetes bacterium GWA2_40_15]OFX95662.1 MAG: hypothetical protein A2X06_02795 [Bacteroidetes bacterium GWC2_40_22]OFY58092.1 MAG: hypothetical protein A2X04_07515 [Bacteroidetes bacterium GWF2_41_9]HAM08941.1 hypothetical protein [Bacteroidales bacterium]HBH83261.1 hypothetical protein [Bacteroidales bacterium]
MKSKSTKILRILIIVYAILYFTGIGIILYKGELSLKNLNDILFLLLSVIFLSAFCLLWVNEKMAGIIFMGWNAGVWIHDLCLEGGRDRGMISIMAVPVMVIGALSCLEWYKSSVNPQLSVPFHWKYILRVLLLNYSVLYIIVVISEQFSDKPYDYFSLPFILFPILFLVFIIGFAFSWKHELLAGLIFVLWYIIMLAGSVGYFEFRDSGPWIMFGVPLFLQGLFYIKNYLWFKSG